METAHKRATAPNVAEFKMAEICFKMAVKTFEISDKYKIQNTNNLNDPLNSAYVTIAFDISYQVFIRSQEELFICGMIASIK